MRPETYDRTARDRAEGIVGDGAPKATEPHRGGGNWRDKRSRSNVLLRLASTAEFWHDTQGAAFASVPLDGAVAHWEIGGMEFRQWLSRAYYNECGGAPGATSLGEVESFLAAKAAFGGVRRRVFLRVGRSAGGLALDLCNDRWQSVVVTAEGWQVVANGEAAFRRTRGMGELAKPEPGGTLDDLRTFINVADEDWPLLLAWMVACLRPEGPYPVLFLQGEQGSGKSTQARMLRALLDPNAAPLRAAPKDMHDLCVCAHNSWIVALDNLSTITPWLSDALCRLATGGGFSTRLLYANTAETVFHVQRPVLVTGIDDLATRGDLLDRSIVIQLPAIEACARRYEEELWAEFDRARPALLGALLSAVSEALRNLDQVRLWQRPRMADFARWAEAAAPRLGCAPGAFEALYRERAREHHYAAIDTSLLAQTVANFTARHPWRGTAAELLRELTSLAGPPQARGQGWPRSVSVLGGMLRRVAPHLRAVGVSVEFRRLPKTGRRVIELTILEPRLVEVPAPRAAAIPSDTPPNDGVAVG